MIPVAYEALCPHCHGDLRGEEIEEGHCQVTHRPLHDAYKRGEEGEFEDFFRRIVGEPRELQRFWMRRLLMGESFTAVAPTGIGKTTFGLAYALFNALRGRRSYLIVPTTVLVDQCIQTLREFCGRLGVKLGLNDEGEVSAAYYHTGMGRGERKRFEEALRRAGILITTSQFLSRNFHLLEDLDFDFIFIDDVDAILKASRNVERVLRLLGLERNGDEWSGKPRGVLMVSTATARRGRAARLFREVLGLDIGSSTYTLRNIEDYVAGAPNIGEVKRILRTLGRGCLLYARTIEEARKFQEQLSDEFRVGLVVSGDQGDLERFQRGELDHLIGTAHFYGLLVRGLDLPELVRYVIFLGAPIQRVRIEELTPRMVKILAIIMREDEEIRRYIGRIWDIERRPAELEELRSLIAERLREGRVEDIVYREGEVIFPDLRTYIQGSGRASRLTAWGLTKGVSILFEEDAEILEAFKRRGEYYDIDFKPLSEADLEALSREIDESRRRGVEVSIRPALFIVESPTKAKQIARFFGRPSVRVMEDLIVYEVATERYILLIAASLGHIVDLSTDRGFHGVEVDGGFRPIYSTIKRCRDCGYQFTRDSDHCPKCGGGNLDDSRGRIEALRRLAYEAGLAIIGTDPDAEGEKIAWDIANLLRGLSEVRRAEFHEVTPRAIREALRGLREIDERLVRAQIVRRIEDRWIGFTLSQRLWDAFNKRGISAGRVQTPVLRWIIEQGERYRRRRRVAYAPELAITLEGVEGDEVEVEIKLLEERHEARSPLPPYTTDEMLRDANRLLRMSSSTAMKLAQELFERGLITYHRTDSTRVSDVGLNVAKSYLGSDFRGRTWSLGEEGAHECIRPTRPWDRETLRRMIYEGVLRVEGLTAKHLALYDLIFRRFMASQAPEIEVYVKRYLIKYSDRSLTEERVLRAEGRAIQLYRSVKVDRELPLGRMRVHIEWRLIPEGYPYTQADVIRLMRERSIGRPSTYASILQKLFDRGYIYERRRWLLSTKLGKAVCQYLDTHYGQFVSEDRTRRLLEKMDSIERGEANYIDVLTELYNEVKTIA